MNTLERYSISRKAIAIRLIYTLMFLVIFELLKLITVFSTLFQFIYLLIAGNYSEPLRRFCNRLSAYAYRIVRYVTLNDNTRPFPFCEFPNEMDPSETQIFYRD
jgi:hypothetical protein